MGKLLFSLIFVLGLFNGALAQTNAQPSQDLVNVFLERRQALLADSKVDLLRMSQSIRQAISLAEQLEQRNPRLAFAPLRALEVFCPLLEFPSYAVHTTAARLYLKFPEPDPAAAAAHQDRAEAMREVLERHLGSGSTPDHALRLIMPNDMVEWARLQQLAITDVKEMPYQGKDLQIAQVTGPKTGNKPTQVFFEVQQGAQFKATASLFSPIPVSEMSAEHRNLLKVGQEKRKRFLDDKTFPYLDLRGRIGDTMREAAELDRQGKPHEALTRLKSLESIRPVEDIPTTDLISVYSALHGKIGDTRKQQELRGLLFGINQAIAHSGNALTMETAIEVILISEEYTWLSDKKLTRTRQRVQDSNGKKYDVLTAKDSAGQERDYFFDITAMYPKAAQGLILK
jgi:hypothetical protein